MTAPAPMRVAAAQAESVSGDVAANVTTAVDLVEEAAAGGARVVVLPELFLTGYDEQAWGGDLTPADPVLAPLSAAARVTGTVVVVGAELRRGPSWHTLSTLVLDRTGAVHAPYDKQHLSGVEQVHFAPGDHGATITVDGWDLGLGICYDGSFPEHARDAAEHGALAYLASIAFFRGSDHRRDLYYAARALDNGMYVVVAGLSGRCGAHEFSGGSAVHDPEGRTLTRAGTVRAVVWADLDAAVVRSTRQAHPMLAEHRASLGERRTLPLP